MRLSSCGLAESARFCLNVTQFMFRKNLLFSYIHNDILSELICHPILYGSPSHIIWEILDLPLSRRHHHKQYIYNHRYRHKQRIHNNIRHNTDRRADGPRGGDRVIHFVRFSCRLHDRGKQILEENVMVPDVLVSCKTIQNLFPNPCNAHVQNRHHCGLVFFDKQIASYMPWMFLAVLKGSNPGTTSQVSILP